MVIDSKIGGGLKVYFIRVSFQKFVLILKILQSKNYLLHVASCLSIAS